MKTFAVPILAPAGLDADDAADWRLDQMDRLVASFPVLWEPQFNDEFRSIIRGAAHRGFEELKKNGKVRDQGKDVVLTMTRIDVPSNVHLRGDTRYSSERMANFLKTSSKDLIPPIIGDVQSMHLLDGHHRWRAYLLANIQPLVVIISTKASSGKEPQYVSQVDQSVFMKTPIDEDAVDEVYETVIRKLLTL